MRNIFYILVLLFSISCKKEQGAKLDPVISKKDTIVTGLQKKQSVSINKDLNINKDDSIYKWFKPKEFSNLERRTVKAINGLNIRDSLGNKIGKLDFGETIYVLKYSKDFLEIEDSGKKVKGRTAKIVTKWSNERIKVSENHYKHNWYVKNKDIGFVFEGFLYKNHEEEDKNSLYSYGYLVVGEKGEESRIDLRKLLSIDKVSLNKYNSRFVEESEFKQPNKFEKINGEIKLVFENNKTLILKDTTYQSEYNPTKSYRVFYHKDFPESYMVSETMFFMPDIHTELSIKTGDTLNKFNGYPYVSPNKNYVVLVTHDLTECYHDTYFEIHKKGLDNTYKSILAYMPNSWSYPFKKNNQSSMDDIFNIHWLSDNEFIINSVDYIEDCYEPNKLSKPFYLKFKIKI